MEAASIQITFFKPLGATRTQEKLQIEEIFLDKKVLNYFLRFVSFDTAESSLFSRTANIEKNYDYN